MAIEANTELALQSFRLFLNIISGLQQHVSKLDDRLSAMENQWMIDMTDTTATAAATTSIGHRVVNRVNMKSKTKQTVTINGQQSIIRVSIYHKPAQTSRASYAFPAITAPGFKLDGKQILVVKQDSGDGFRPVWLVKRELYPLLSITGKNRIFVNDSQLLLSGERELSRTIGELLEINQQLDQNSRLADIRLNSHLADLSQWPNLLQIARSQLTELSRRVFRSQELVVTMIDFIEQVACVPKSMAKPLTTITTTTTEPLMLGSVWTTSLDDDHGVSVESTTTISTTGAAVDSDLSRSMAVRVTDPGKSRLTALITRRRIGSGQPTNLGATGSSGSSNVDNSRTSSRSGSTNGWPRTASGQQWSRSRRFPSRAPDLETIDEDIYYLPLRRYIKN